MKQNHQNDKQENTDHLSAIKECHPCQQGKTLLVMGAVFALYAFVRFMVMGHVSVAAAIVAPTMIVIGLIARRQYGKAVCAVEARTKD